MGYTHYWYRPKELDAEKFAEFSAQVLYLLSNLPEKTMSAGGHFQQYPLKIIGLDGDKSPVINAELVGFNGGGKVPDTKEDLRHEEFILHRVFWPEDWELPRWGGRYFDFCKTARKPYDLAVCLALIAFREIFGEAVIVSSDGQAGEWEEAFQLYNRLMGTELTYEKIISPKPEPDEEPPEPDFFADNSAPIGSREWRSKNGIAPDWTVTATEDGGWVAESRSFALDAGKRGKSVKTADAKGNGKMLPVVIFDAPASVPAPPAAESAQLPETVQSIISQMGRRGLRGALVYVGASQLGYKCPRKEGECRSSYSSHATERGQIAWDVGVAFRVNGKPRENWTIIVAYEPDDVYSVWLWRRATQSEFLADKVGAVMDHRTDVYCEDLQHVVERMYDQAIQDRNAGFIPI